MSTPAHGHGVPPGAAGLLRADAPVHRAGHAAATVNVEPGGFGGIESQLALNGPEEFAAGNALTFTYRAIRGSSFRCVSAPITALGLAAGEMVAVSRETGVAERNDESSPSLDAAETMTGNVVFTMLALGIYRDCAHNANVRWENARLPLTVTA